MRRMLSPRLRFIVITVVVCAVLAEAAPRSMYLSPSVPLLRGATQELLVRHSRAPETSSPECGPNPLYRLAHVMASLAGDEVSSDALWQRLNESPHLQRELLTLLNMDSYHNCVKMADAMHF